jgi:hypothetical protein
MKYNNLNLGQIEAIVNKLGGMDGVAKFLRDELAVTEKKNKWYEKDGVIYFTVTSDGTTGEEWISRLKSKYFIVSDYAKSILSSKSFKWTAGVTYEIAVLKGEDYSGNRRFTKDIRKEAENLKFSVLNVEVACLIRDKFFDEELKAMGIVHLVIMHKPVKNSEGDPILLAVERSSYDSYLGTFYDNSARNWNSNYGFAFVASQKEVV